MMKITEARIQPTVRKSTTLSDFLEDFRVFLIYTIVFVDVSSFDLGILDWLSVL